MKSKNVITNSIREVSTASHSTLFQTVWIRSSPVSDLQVTCRFVYRYRQTQKWIQNFPEHFLLVIRESENKKRGRDRSARARLPASEGLPPGWPPDPFLRWIIFLKERTNARARPRQGGPRKNGKFTQAESLLQDTREKPANDLLPGGSTEMRQN